MSATYNAVQLDALRELANIGAGNASTALSGILGRPVDLTVPDARLIPMAEAVEAIGPPATATDMLASLVEAVLATRAAHSDSSLLLDSRMVVEGEGCSIVFLLVPDDGGAGQLLERLGVT